MFPNLRTKTDCFNEDIEYNAEEHKLTEKNLDEEILQFVVQNIFKKAQDEKLFCILNGQLCERLIDLELQLRDYQNKISNLKHSKFRANLLKECQECFIQFFKDKPFDSTAAAEEMDAEQLK